MEVRLIKGNEIELVSHFLAELNNKDEFHIGYCGKVSEEIANSILYDLTDVGFKESFVCAFEGNQLVGVLGFDADLNDQCAELWGPFALDNDDKIICRLWNRLLDIIPSEVHSVSMFPNRHNRRVLNFANEIGFAEQSKQTILVFNRESIHALVDIKITELSKELEEQMTELHDLTFPSTYFSGREILNRLNGNRKVFIQTSNRELTGYIYVEAEPEFGEASIEFFAVNPSKQGKGLGVQLLSAALKWLFSFQTIHSISLCVNSSNEKAINLYKKVGFITEHELAFLTKNIRKV
ncbi:GNAT family N-acetyltransferase [Bacillus pinisoli]|uniref:GNAT family N-acetyltransferase n=1 Tax=Bacillus pinisoli TaxID=2901866 RepID=UPI001FF361A1|nr:GNAT family N-acetyltransferase [Bacillus pinisoli]